MRCFECDCEMQNKTSLYETLLYGGIFIYIENVSFEFCPKCNESLYTDESSKYIESKIKEYFPDYFIH